MDLLGNAELDRSSIVANCRMNRERDLAGPNGYARELGFNPLDFLRGRAADDRGRLLVEHPNFMNHFVPVERVAYHAIFEDDIDFLTALALWGGPCLPGARGMMDLRLPLPGLARALAVTRFGVTSQ